MYICDGLVLNLPPENKPWNVVRQLKKKYMIRKISIITFLITIFSLFSCGQNNENLNHSTPEKKVQTSKTIIKKNLDNDLNSLDHFKGFPEEIVGCSCYFSETNTNFKNEEFLFVADYDSIAFISVNKKKVKLKLVSTTREPNTFGNYNHTDIYKSELYKVTLDIKYKDSTGYEVWWNDGTLTIENKDGKKMTKKFVGECGC